MAIKELKLNLDSKTSNIVIKGRREVLSRMVEGGWATLFKGRGMEFTGYRQYSFSDDASAIDWRASLRSKETLVREFEEFKNFNVFFLLDTSNSMLFTSGEYLKAEFAASVLYNLSEEASNSGDAVGMAIFNDKIKEQIQPSYGKGMRVTFTRFLKNTKNYGGIRKFKYSMLELTSLLSERCVIVIFSDFLGLPDDWSRYVQMLSQKHQIIGIMIRDKRDRVLPNTGQFYLKDPNSDETIYIDSKKFAKEYKDYAKEDELKVIKVFKNLKSDCLVLENNDTEYKDKLRKFFNKMYNLDK